MDNATAKDRVHLFCGNMVNLRLLRLSRGNLNWIQQKQKIITGQTFLPIYSGANYSRLSNLPSARIWREVRRMAVEVSL